MGDPCIARRSARSLCAAEDVIMVGALAGAELRAAFVIIDAPEPFATVDAIESAVMNLIIIAAVTAIITTADAMTIAVIIIAVTAATSATAMIKNWTSKTFRISKTPMRMMKMSRNRRPGRNTCKPTNEHLVY